MTKRHLASRSRAVGQPSGTHEGSFVICGIAGLYARGGGAVSDRLIVAQCDAILHRGPDDQGIMTDGDFGFGMRRLSIIDIAGGHQPVHSPDHRYVLIFNGEIYNFRKLRRELKLLGRAFASASDTEVILAGYEQWGDDVWAKLDGMFAVAIWDVQRRRLTLARDPVGIKPLYYTDQAAGFAFGSELKTLTLLPGMVFDVDRRALHDYFSFGHVRTPRSIYAQVQTLPPGHVLTVEATGAPTMHAYWTPAYCAGEIKTEAQWVERFSDVWRATIAGQMVADVDIGAFLSGGVDSSAVVAAMAQVSDRPVRTFTIGFPDPRFDESPHAEAIARHLGCRHVTRTLELTDAQALLPEVQHCYDEPFADPSAVPTWYVSQIAAQEVKVVLSGDGGDELFFGYKRHATERRIGSLPASLRRLARAIDAVPTLPSRHVNAVLQRWRKTTGSAALPNGVARFFAKTQITNAAFRREIFSADFMAEEEGGIAALVAEYFPDAETISADTLEQFGLADLTLNLPGAMLTKVDRASMAHSLEVRVPMLGQAMVDLALAMPADMKLKRGVGKYVVRQAIAPSLPEGVLDRRKQGFQMPLAAWFAGDFGAYAEQLWRDSGVREQGVWRTGVVDKVFDDHRAGKRDYSRFLYALAIYCLWWMGRPQALAIRML